MITKIIPRLTSSPDAQDNKEDRSYRALDAPDDEGAFQGGPANGDELVDDRHFIFIGKRDRPRNGS